MSSCFCGKEGRYDAYSMKKQYFYNSAKTVFRLFSRFKKQFHSRLALQKLAFLVISFLVLPATVAYAGFFSFLGDMFVKTEPSKERSVNSQNMNLLQAANTPEGERGRGGADVSVVGGTALLADAGPSGALPDVDDEGGSANISIYEVRDGDSFASIANMFDVSVNTILWANNLNRKSTLKVGQTLVILPVSGVQHTVKKGDTIAKIAKMYKGDPGEISDYNGIALDQSLDVGSIIIVPDGEVPAPSVAKTKPLTSKLRGAGGPSYSGYYRSPLANYIKTQGLHGYNGVDLATYVGAPIMAAAEGEVIVSRQGGYNGGYGNYVVIRHPNGTQTLYGHMLSNAVTEGQHVEQGQTVGYLGNTGRSTGPHLHFEVRGARNPF